MKEFFSDIYNSLKTSIGGFSSRKLSACGIMICVIIAHIAWIKRAFSDNNFTMMESILTIDYTFVATCLGMTTYERMKNKSTGDNSTIQQTTIPDKTQDESTAKSI